jgi:hypothetical protein
MNEWMREIGLLFADVLRMFIMNEYQFIPVACSVDLPKYCGSVRVLS